MNNLNVTPIVCENIEDPENSPLKDTFSLINISNSINVKDNISKFNVAILINGEVETDYVLHVVIENLNGDEEGSLGYYPFTSGVDWSNPNTVHHINNKTFINIETNIPENFNQALLHIYISKSEDIELILKEEENIKDLDILNTLRKNNKCILKSTIVLDICRE